MRVLLTLHHHLDPNLGAPGATLALGAALERAGCQVDYWGFERAFPGHKSGWGVRHSLLFPWRTSAFLRRNASSFDVIDASTGDAWVWAASGRPGSDRRTALVTRSHGLEHTADAQVRREARESGRRLSWKYPIYHGGWRLNEVATSLRLADTCLVLNEVDRDYARDVLGVEGQRLTITPMGVADFFFDHPGYKRPIPKEPASGKPLKLAYLGSWIPRKGSAVLCTALNRLQAAGVPFHLTALGTGTTQEDAIRAEFEPAVRPFVSVVPRFAHTELPDLLSGIHALVFPSLSEGFSRALVEAMSCGLAPVATAVGGAPSVIVEGKSGFLIPPGDTAALESALQTLYKMGASDLQKMRTLARTSSEKYRWESIARLTMQAYRNALAVRSGAIPLNPSQSGRKGKEPVRQ